MQGYLCSSWSLILCDLKFKVHSKITYWQKKKKKLINTLLKFKYIFFLNFMKLINETLKSSYHDKMFKNTILSTEKKERKKKYKKSPWNVTDTISPFIIYPAIHTAILPPGIILLELIRTKKNTNNNKMWCPIPITRLLQIIF